LTCAIIVSKTEHGNNIAKLIPEAVEVYGPTARKKRKKIWEDLQDRSIKVVITTLMDEATNIPSLDAVALAAGGKSKVKLVQRLRNLRTFSGETSEGFYTKERGFVFITKDNTDFLRSHSTLNVSYLTDLVSQHPDNTHEEISL
jgi:superfamily II DNA or RNA helicase